ncbi:MAG: glycoside hydrolase [Mucilaginibacter sp.]|nr:glycoside hydrolase [Mucilaginibacter sp.]
MKTKFFSIVTLLICSAMICFAVITDLTGKWTGTVKIQDGNDFPLTYVFKTDGNNLTGSLQSPQGELPITDGKINGSNFSFKLDFNGTPIVNTGKYYGDSIAIEAEINGNKLHTVLKRTNN